jgi:cobalamin transport system ATP-binding protein
MTRHDQSGGKLTYEVEQLSFRYGGKRRHVPDDRGSWVVKDMNFSVRQGEMFGVIGPNGSGKSSLLKVLAKLAEPQEGTVRLFRARLDTLSRNAIARQVAYMPQDLSSDFAFTALDMVLMGRFPYRRPRKWSLLGWEQRSDHLVVQQAMEQADVTHLADREMGTLSAGERQRVLLARALAQEPGVLLLDEPTAHLDLQHQLDLCRILKRMHVQHGMTVLLVSHDINLASQYCDRVLIMKEGCRMYLGSPLDVITQPNLKEVYGCQVLIDAHPETGLPRVSLPRESPMRSC